MGRRAGQPAAARVRERAERPAAGVDPSDAAAAGASPPAALPSVEDRLAEPDGSAAAQVAPSEDARQAAPGEQRVGAELRPAAEARRQEGARPRAAAEAMRLGTQRAAPVEPGQAAAVAARPPEEEPVAAPSEEAAAPADAPVEQVPGGSFRSAAERASTSGRRALRGERVADGPPVAWPGPAPRECRRRSRPARQAQGVAAAVAPPVERARRARAERCSSDPRPRPRTGSRRCCRRTGFRLGTELARIWAPERARPSATSAEPRRSPGARGRAGCNGTPAGSGSAAPGRRRGASPRPRRG